MKNIITDFEEHCWWRPASTLAQSDNAISALIEWPTFAITPPDDLFHARRLHAKFSLLNSKHKIPHDM